LFPARRRRPGKLLLVPDEIDFSSLGHRIAGVRGIYSHVTPAMQLRITEALKTAGAPPSSDRQATIGTCRPPENRLSPRPTRHRFEAESPSGRSGPP
jgi:hypothetical protein